MTTEPTGAAHAANAESFVASAFRDAQKRAGDRGTPLGASIFTPQESLTLAGVCAVMALRADLLDSRSADASR